jgi:hypothetical protein
MSPGSTQIISITRHFQFVPSNQRLYITITILDIIHRHLKQDVSETALCRLQAKPTQMGPIDRVSELLRAPATTPIWFIKPT